MATIRAANSHPCRNCPLCENGLFNNLPRSEVNELKHQCRTNHYRRGQIIFYEGNPALSVYCIREGSAKIYKTNLNGKHQIVRFARTGDLVGYRSVLADEAYQATAQALEDSEVCLLDKVLFLRMLTHNRVLSLKVIHKLSCELGQAEQVIQEVTQQSVRTRLAKLLLALYTNAHSLWPAVQQNGFHLTREEMAETIGTTQETVVRLLSELKKDGMIRIEKRCISVCDRQALLELTSSAAY